ncbi:MAG TPA: hypothetical protein VEI73_02175 [Candidatus Acidoferrum sp.]|nr:hypothetical protein [Candidatus Acidoferrum sp.]
MRNVQKKVATRILRRRQRDVLCDVMLGASQCGTWLTLDELTKLTHYPQASISAQLRHLRKPQFGGYEVEKRQRKFGRAMRGEDFGTVWEYRLRRRVRRILGGQPAIRLGARIRSSASGRWTCSARARCRSAVFSCQEENAGRNAL